MDRSLTQSSADEWDGWAEPSAQTKQTRAKKQDSKPTRRGGPITTAALVREVKDALANRDGIVANEKGPALSMQKLPPFSKQPFLNLLTLLKESGCSTRDEEAYLDQFVREQERIWGQPVTDLPPQAFKELNRFIVQKTAALVRYGRKPQDVTEGFLDARGTVDGLSVTPRKIFWQRWKPTGAPSGKVVVISPGYAQTGRMFLAQAKMCNDKGHDVILMDHQWAGFSSGHDGKIDRGYGVIRDVAAVTAFADQICQREYGQLPGHEVLLMGGSMGAAGILGAATLNDQGKIQLQGAVMPRGVSAVLLETFMTGTPSLRNKGITAIANIPGAKSLPMTVAGTDSHDPIARSRMAQNDAIEGIKVAASAFPSATKDWEKVSHYIANGQGPMGRFYFIHSEKDPLASPAAARAVSSDLGPQSKFVGVPGNNHVLEGTPAVQPEIERGLDWIANRKN